MVRRERRRSALAAAVSRDAFVLVERNPALVTAVCLTALSILAICAALYSARAYLMPIAAAFVFSVILAPICSRLEWIKLPRSIAAFLALVIASAILYIGFSLIAAPATRWLENAPATLQRAERQFKKLQEPLRTVRELSDEVNDLSLVPPAPSSARTVVVQGPELTQSLIASAQVIAVQTTFIFVLTYFFLVTREEFRLKMIAFQLNLPGRVRTARAFRDTQQRVSGYIVTFSLINVAFGAAIGLAVWRLGLPEPAMWGGIAALLNFVPYLGPAVTVGLLGLAGLATFDTLIEAAFPVMAYMALNFVETNMLTPMIMGRRMTLNPLAIVLSVSFWTWIWGPVGGLISLPLLIMFKVVCDHTPAMRLVGALIGAPLDRHKGRDRVLFWKKRATTPAASDPAQIARPESGPTAIPTGPEHSGATLPGPTLPGPNLPGLTPGGPLLAG
ncbi:MAG: AI-2E family transporter [Alphaproteobacteria bacterium]|nr:AI-2E family transporter [Alphaproteobacteria bacterium]